MKNFHGMIVFLGMTNYQWNFVKCYSNVTAPLTDLLKKDKQWNWMARCHVVFEYLKRRIVTTLMRKLPNIDFAIEGVLMQDGYLVEYQSWKLQDKEQWHPVHEKGITTIIH